MSLNIEQKKHLVSEIKEEIKDAGVVVLAEYSGLEVGEMTDLRVRAREKGVYLKVLKNTLAKRAVTGSPFEGLTGSMKGPLAYGISPDPVAAAKVLVDFANQNEKLVISIGGLPNKIMTSQEVKQLATMPSRDELLSKLMGTLQAPTGKLVRVLSEVPAGFLRTLMAIRDQKENAT